MTLSIASGGLFKACIATYRLVQFLFPFLSSPTSVFGLECWLLERRVRGIDVGIAGANAREDTSKCRALYLEKSELLLSFW